MSRTKRHGDAVAKERAWVRFSWCYADYWTMSGTEQLRFRERMDSVRLYRRLLPVTSRGYSEKQSRMRWLRGVTSSHHMGPWSASR